MEKSIDLVSNFGVDLLVGNLEEMSELTSDVNLVMNQILKILLNSGNNVSSDMDLFLEMTVDLDLSVALVLKTLESCLMSSKNISGNSNVLINLSSNGNQSLSSLVVSLSSFSSIIRNLVVNIAAVTVRSRARGSLSDSGGGIWSSVDGGGRSLLNQRYVLLESSSLSCVTGLLVQYNLSIDNLVVMSGIGRSALSIAGTR